MATAKTVWGIDIGHCALKALKLSGDETGLRVESFDIIEHPQILSQPDADRDQLIRNALEQFLARNEVVGSTVAISVPGQTSFTRFVKLPPVESRKIPDIVRFEAEQQIPFPIEEVIWQWQTFEDPDSPDVEVGIFAMKRADIESVLGHFRQVALDVDVVQMAPLSLYNFMVYDDQTADEPATLLADVGADTTDLVVADGARIWTRTIQIGGNNFTEALVRAFKLSFAKAEKLKRTAASSKYARQIFQAMRPVFADLVQEIQRSIGYYTSLHRETRFKKLVGLGNGFRLPGLQKFLEQNLSIPVSRVDTFNRLQPGPDVNAPAFNENVLSCAVAYGLAAQGLEQSRVATNLLPGEVSRKRVWARKRPWWAAAAAMILAALAIMLFRSYADRASLAAGLPADAQREVRRLDRLKSEYRRLSGQGDEEVDQIAWYVNLYNYRNFWPSVETLVSRSIRSGARDQAFYEAYSRVTGTGPEAQAKRQEVLDRLAAKPRSEWAIVQVENMEVRYVDDVNAVTAESLLQGDRRTPTASPVAAAAESSGAATAEPTAPRRGCWVVIDARTPLSRGATNQQLLPAITRRSEEIADVLTPLKLKGWARTVRTEAEVRRDTETRTPRRMPGRDGEEATPEVVMPDPLFPEMSMARDTGFRIGWLIEVVEEDIAVPEPQSEQPE